MARETQLRMYTLPLLSVYFSALLRCGGSQLFHGHSGNPEGYQVVSAYPLGQGESTVKLSCPTMGSPKNSGTAYVCVPTTASINLNFRPGGTGQSGDKTFFESLLKQLYNLYLNNRCPGKYEASLEKAPEAVKCTCKTPQSEVDCSPVEESCEIPAPKNKCEEQPVLVKHTDDCSESADPDDGTEVDITDESQPSYEDEDVKITPAVEEKPDDYSEAKKSQSHHVTVDISHKSHHSHGQEDKPEGKENPVEVEHTQDSSKSENNDSVVTKINISHKSHKPLGQEDNPVGKENPAVVEHPEDHSQPQNHHSVVTEVEITRESHKSHGHEANPEDHPEDHSQSEKPQNDHSVVTEIDISHESHKPLGHDDKPAVVVHSESKDQNDVVIVKIPQESHEEKLLVDENPVVMEHPPPDDKTSDDGEEKAASAAEPHHKHFYGLKCGGEVYTLEDIKRLCPMIAFIKKHWGNRANAPRAP